jgi:hypothetical protein
MGTVFLIALAVSLLQIDNIVHGQLYNYGLQFSNRWALPYWTFLGMSTIFLACIVYLNILSIIYLLRER